MTGMPVVPETKATDRPGNGSRSRWRTRSHHDPTAVQLCYRHHCDWLPPGLRPCAQRSLLTPVISHSPCSCPDAAIDCSKVII